MERMTRQAWVIALLCVATAAGCNTKAGGDDGADATKSVAFTGLTPSEWSLFNANGEWQIALSDANMAHDAQGCALSADQHNTGLGTSGGEIIIHLPAADDGSTPATPCPANNYTLQKCTNNLGTGAFVPAGCAFYRQFDPNGAVIGTAASLTGVVKIAGDGGACTMIVTVGFLGKSFTAQATLMNSTAVQPWCVRD
jgi:hypothetical protein